MENFMIKVFVYMYVLECLDGIFYIGYIIDVKCCFNIYNIGKGVKYICVRLLVKFFYFEVFNSK